MKLFTLKRFFVVTLLMCLGISQGWAASETKTITLNAKPAENGVLSWTSEDGMVTFSLAPEPEYQNEGRYKMTPEATYRLTWAHNYDRVKYDFGVNQFVETYAATRTGGEYRLGIEIHPSSGGNVGSNSANAWVGNFDSMYENWDGNKWRTLSANLVEPLGEDGYIELKVGPADQAALGFISRRYFEYYLKEMQITYTLTEREFSAKVTATANIPAGGTAKVNNQSSYTQGDIISDEIVAAGSKQYNFTLSATPNEGYDFLGWSETADGEFFSEDAETEYSITCDLSTIAKEKTLYAIFVKRFDKVAMDVKMVQVLRTVNTWAKATDVPTQGSNFIIASSNSNRALANNAGSSVSLSLTDGFYDGDVNDTNMPFTYKLDNDGYIQCSNGNYLNGNYNNGLFGLGAYGYLSLDGTKKTKWTVKKVDEGFQVSCKLNNNRSTYYIANPSNNGGGFNMQTNATTINFYIPTTREKYVPEQDADLEFAIKADYATVYCEDAYMMPFGENDAKLTGYFVKGADEDGEYLTLDEKYHSGEIVPAGTALLIEGPLSTNYKATKYAIKNGGTDTAKEYTDANENQLEGTRVNGLTHSKYDDGTGNVLYYKLSYGPSGTKYDDVLGFWWGDPNGGAFKPSNPYTAFLAVVKGAVTPAHGFSLPMGDDDTLNSIEIVESVDSAYESDAVYTISGMRVNDSENLPAGIYIRNGKKFMVR